MGKRGFKDVSDEHSPPTPRPPPPVSDCPVNDYLLKQGFGFKRDKLADCLRQLEDSRFDVWHKVAFCIHNFLFSDLHSCGCGILPTDLGLHTFLHGPYVLQVDEIVNPSNPPQSSRYEESPSWVERRFQKLSMTDGIHRVDGIVLERTYELHVSAPRGLKVSISNVDVFRGKLILGPENITILGGGLVEQLDESQLNKPSKEKSNGVLAARPSSRVDDPSPETPPPPPPVPETQTSDGPVNDFLLKHGFGFNRDKLADCLRQLGDSGFNVWQKAVFCIKKFLFSDLNSCGGGGILPSDLCLQTFLHGPYVLQVDEIINFSLPPQSSRYEEYPPGIQRRFLMLSMTDGIQRVYGIELEGIDDLLVYAPPGLKVSISNVDVVCGKLFLGPENITILGGGLVEQLDESQLNKPSKEKSNGVLAARPSSRVDDPSPETPPPPPPVPETQTSDGPVNDFLLKHGFGFNRDKLADCLRQLGDSGFNVLQKATFCIRKFLFSDLHSWGGGILPSDLSLQTFLHGPYVLQVDEITYGSFLPQSSRYEEDPPGIQERFMTLSMTDGIQRVYGIELERIYELQVFNPPGLTHGLKVSISNVEVFCGKLILRPENITILGGGLDEQLDESQLNKPSKEKSTGVLPLCDAHPSSRVDDPSHSGSMLHGTDTVQSSNQVGAVSLADAPAFKKAPGGAPANVAGGFSKSGGSSASRSEAKMLRYGSIISLIDEPFKFDDFAALKVAIAKDPSGILKAEAVKNHITFILEIANVIKISKDEITFWTGGDVSSMLIHPKIKLLIVTEGSEGFIYYTKDFVGRFSGVDTTGTGDAFNNGILYGMASIMGFSTAWLLT